MTGTYRVTLDNINVGTATVTQQGLYYRITCRCAFNEKGFYCISVQSGEHREYLGVCVPEGDSYILDKSIPIKRFPEKKLFFYASRKKKNSDRTFIPVKTGGDFSGLTELMNGKFESSKGENYIVFPSGTAVQ